MSKVYTILARVTKEQKERIKNKAEFYGYMTVSQFIRDRLLKEDLSTEKDNSGVTVY